MRPDRFQRLELLFEEAIELGGAELQVLLQRVGAEDPELHADLERLLAQDRDESDCLGGSISDEDQQALAGAVRGQHLPTPPDRIGHYRILGVLGQGGMGTVYLAEQEHPHRQVALKVVRLDVLSPGLRERFRFEAEVLGRLQHPGIAQILEAGEVETDGGTVPFFAMEYVEGVELRRYVQRHGLGVRARLELVARICDAAHHAHQKGVIHRDLKPENVLVVDLSSEAGLDRSHEFAELGQPKILDFGIARATDSDVQLTTMQTGVAKIVGTLNYMSPEQLGGDSRLLDTRSDVYALGTLLYELLVGRPPFDLRNRPIPEAAMRILGDEPTHPGELRAELRGDIDTIVCKALEKDRERRYSSAAELAADLRRYLSGDPIAAHPPSTFYQLRKLARRHQGLMAGLALALLILVAGTATSLLLAARATRGEERALLSEARARSAAYRVSLIAAEAVVSSDPGRAQSYLESAPEEYRGWEWWHLRTRVSSHAAEHLSGEPPVPTRERFFLYRTLGVTACRTEGTLLAALPRAEGIELVELESGTVLGVFGQEEGQALPMLSRDGACLAAVSRTHARLVVWDTRSGARLLELPVDPAALRGARLSPDGSLLVLPTREATRILETATGRERFRDAPLHPDTSRIAFSPEADRLALLGEDQQSSSPEGSRFAVRIYTASGELLAERWFHDGIGGTCQSMTYNPDGSLLTIGHTQRAIRILDGATLEDVDLLFGHTDAVSALAFSPDGSLLASGSPDTTIRIWELDTGRTRRVLRVPFSEYGVTSLRFSPDGERLAAGNYLGAWLWVLDLHAGQVLAGHTSYLYRVAYNPQGTLIASSGWDRTVRLWDASTGEALAVLPSADARYDLGFTPDGSRLVGHELWDPAAGVELEVRAEQGEEAPPPPAPANLPAIPRSLRLGAGGSKRASNGEVLSSSWDRSLVAQGLPSGGVLLRDRASGRVVKTIGAHTSQTLAVAFSPDGARILSGHEDGAVVVWNLETGAELATLAGHEQQVYSVNWSPDGSRIVSGSNDCTIGLWDAETYEQTAVLRGHTSYVHSVCFSPDGTQLASASGDGTVRLWDSVPAVERYAEIQRDAALREEAGTLVDRLLRELPSALDVAKRLRSEELPSESLREAALQSLLRRSPPERAERNH